MAQVTLHATPKKHSRQKILHTTAKNHSRQKGKVNLILAEANEILAIFTSIGKNLKLQAF